MSSSEETVVGVGAEAVAGFGEGGDVGFGTEECGIEMGEGEVEGEGGCSFSCITFCPSSSFPTSLSPTFSSSF